MHGHHDIPTTAGRFTEASARGEKRSRGSTKIRSPRPAYAETTVTDTAFYSAPYRCANAAHRVMLNSSTCRQPQPGAPVAGGVDALRDEKVASPW